MTIKNRDTVFVIFSGFPLFFLRPTAETQFPVANDDDAAHTLNHANRVTFRRRPPFGPRRETRLPYQLPPPEAITRSPERATINLPLTAAIYYPPPARTRKKKRTIHLRGGAPVAMGT